MGQAPKRLQPQLSAAHLLGARLRTLREAAGLSLVQLGDLVFCSPDLIRRVETAERRAHPDLIAACDDVLAAGGGLVRLLRIPARVDAGPDHGVAVASVPAIRRALDRDDWTDDRSVRSRAELSSAVSRLVECRLQSRYDELAAALPGLLDDLHRACTTTPSREVARLLLHTYRAADAIADKHYVPDLSARLIDRMRELARVIDDPLDLATVAYVRTELFMTSGDFNAGCRALEHAITRHPVGERHYAAARGALHMRCAVLAARAGDPHDADDHLDAADQLADVVPDGIYQGTAFGPSSVRIHRVAVAVDADDNDTAIRIGHQWQPGAHIPAERRSHFHIDLAHAHLDVGDRDESLRGLHRAVAAAPQHARSHRRVHATVVGLLAGMVRTDRSLLDLARWTGVQT